MRTEVAVSGFVLLAAALLACIVMQCFILFNRFESSSTDDIFIIRDPSISQLFECSVTRASLPFESHLGYSIATALGNPAAYSILIPVRPKAIQIYPAGYPPLMQLKRNSSSETVANVDVKRKLPDCLDFETFLQYGYCFISFNVTQSSSLWLNFEIAWWKPAFSLVVAYAK